MEHRPEMILQAVVKSLRDNVVPAVDAENAPAQQQLAIGIALIEIVLSRIPLMYRYDRQDLTKLAELAETLLATDAPRGEALRAQVDRAADVLARARADPGELAATIAALRDGIGRFATIEQARGDADRVRAVRKAIVASAGEMILRERAWVAPFGFEADPQAIPPIETLLAGCA